MPRHVVLISQVYSPDPAAVGRLMADVATALAQRGNRVTVFTADRGYDNPAVRYTSAVTAEGVDVRRLPFSSFGKRSLALRACAGLSFVLQAALRTVLLRDVDTVVVTTAPPMGALSGVIAATLRRVRLIYWPMDLNPDQVLALNLATPKSRMVRLLEWCNRAVLKRASVVVALDQFMAKRLERKRAVADKLVVIPPWGEADEIADVPRESNPFREQHGFGNKKVIMYSGTLGPSNPVDTLLDAAREFENDQRALFVFVGGGTGMQQVREEKRANILCLPYEPIERMRFSLCAADVHVVSLGDSMAGIVHPCKVYGAMTAGRPILFLGPDEAHVTEMMAERDFGWHVRHGDVNAMIAVLRHIVDSDVAALREKGATGRELIDVSRARRVSCSRVCDVIEAGTTPQTSPSAGQQVLPVS